MDSKASKKSSDSPTDTRKDRVLPNVLNISTNFSKLPEVCLGDSTFLGVAEAYRVPDANSKVGVTMDTLAYVSDEVGTVESLFDDIITEDDIIASSYSICHPRPPSLQQGPEKDEELERYLETGLIYYDNHISSWLPESLSRAVHQLPFLQRTPSTIEYKDESAHDYLLDNSSDVQTGLDDNILDNREVCFDSNQGYQNDNQYGEDCFADESDWSVLLTKQGTNKWITSPESLILGKMLEPKGRQHNENKVVDSSVLCASAMEHNMYQELCLCPQENENCMCSFW